MPMSGSSRRSSATRCSAERPRSPNASRSPRTSLTCLSGGDPAERAAALGQQHQSAVARAVRGPARGRGRPRHTGCRPRPTRHLGLGHPGVAGLDRQLGAVLLGVESDRRGLDPHRKVLGDQRDVGTLGAQVERHRQDAGVVVAEPETGRQDRGIAVVQLDAQACRRCHRSVPRHRACRAVRGARRGLATRSGRSSPAPDALACLRAR